LSRSKTVVLRAKDDTSYATYYIHNFIKASKKNGESEMEGILSILKI